MSHMDSRNIAHRLADKRATLATLTGRSQTIIGVVVIAHQGLFRGALAAMLSAEEDISVVGQGGQIEDVPTEALLDDSDVIVIDLERSEPPDLGPIRQLADKLRRGTILILVQRLTPIIVRQALDLGVRAVIPKDSQRHDLVDSIRRVAHGEWVMDALIAREAVRTTQNPLTTRERDVLRFAAAGLPVREIAAQLFLSPGTVRNHLSAAIRKLGVPDLGAAVRQVQDYGWL
jgi:two-component system response regulator DesR